MKAFIGLCSVLALTYGDINAVPEFAQGKNGSNTLLTQVCNASLYSENIEEVKAADENKLDVIEYLVVEAKANTNKLDRNGFLPLTFAVLNGSVGATKLLVK